MRPHPGASFLRLARYCRTAGRARRPPPIPCRAESVQRARAMAWNTRKRRDQSTHGGGRLASTSRRGRIAQPGRYGHRAGIRPRSGRGTKGKPDIDCRFPPPPTTSPGNPTRSSWGPSRPCGTGVARAAVNAPGTPVVRPGRLRQTPAASPDQAVFAPLERPGGEHDYLNKTGQVASGTPAGCLSLEAQRDLTCLDPSRIGPGPGQFRPGQDGSGSIGMGQAGGGGAQGRRSRAGPQWRPLEAGPG